MADEEEIMLQGKTLAELRVVDLKKECDKRGISKSGSKMHLIERLKAQLLLEKMQQQPVNDTDEAPNIKLKEDELTGNNAFIKQYFEKQQKILGVEREARKRFSEEESESSQDERPLDSPKKKLHEPSIPENPVPNVQESNTRAPPPPPLAARKPPPPPPNPPPSLRADGGGDGKLGRSSSYNEEEAEPVEQKLPKKSRRWRREPETKEPETERASRSRRQTPQDPAKKETPEKTQETEAEKQKEEETPEPPVKKSVSAAKNLETEDVHMESDKQQEERAVITERRQSGNKSAPVVEDVQEVAPGSTKEQDLEPTKDVDTTQENGMERLQKKEDVQEGAQGRHDEMKVADGKRENQADKSGDSNNQHDNEKEKSDRRSRSPSSSSRSRSRSPEKEKRSSSHSRSRSRTPKKTIASRITRRDSSSSSRSSRSRSRSSSSNSSPSPRSKRTSRSPSPPRSKQISRSPSPKSKRKSSSPSPPRSKQMSRSPSPPRSKKTSRSPSQRSEPRSRSPSPPKSKQKSRSPSPRIRKKSKSPADSRSSSSDSDRSRSQSPDQKEASPARAARSPSPVNISQKCVREEEQMDAESPGVTNDENAADPVDTLIVTEDTSEKALDQKEEVSVRSASRNTTPRRISLTGRDSKDDKEDKADDIDAEKESKKEKPVRKRKWGSSRSSTDSKPVKRFSNINISTDSLKELIPEIKMTEPVLDLGNDDERISDLEEDHRDVVKIRRTVVMKEDSKTDKMEEEEAEEVKEPAEEDQKESDVSSSEEEEEEGGETKEDTPKKVTPKKEPTIIRRVSQPVAIVETDDPIAPPRSPSPARNPLSKIVHVRNLVRPFTLNQLKELLRRTGTISEEEFWIDKIKSHCFVMYETEDQAEKTRKALHNTKWPSSNPKILRLEYSSKDEIEFHKQKEQGQRPKIVRRESQQELKEKREKEREKKVKEKEVQRKKEEAKKPPPVREWDLDKIRQSKERDPRPDVRGHRRSRSASPGRVRQGRERSRERERPEKKVVPEKKAEEEPPAKLLDDLFKKTKTIPCIYWLPLTDAQAETREKERNERIAMREKMRAETSGENRAPYRADRPDFDRRRPPSPYRRSSPPRRGNEQDSYRDRSGPRRPPDRPAQPPRTHSKSPRRRR